jgi:two-component system chemotaxis response regulator CheB
VFESAAKAFGDRVIGVILTGLLRDGTVGLKAVHDAGGLTIVQDPAEAEYPDMPTSAMKDLPVTFCLRLSDIGLTLDLLARRKAMLETGLAVSVRTLKERVALLIRLVGQSKKNPQTFEFLSTELAALKLDLGSIQKLLDLASAAADERTAGK